MFAGEFGIVYKAHYLQGIKKNRATEPQIVAVKTLKGGKGHVHVIMLIVRDHYSLMLHSVKINLLHPTHTTCTCMSIMLQVSTRALSDMMASLPLTHSLSLSLSQDTLTKKQSTFSWKRV